MQNSEQRHLIDKAAYLGVAGRLQRHVKRLRYMVPRSVIGSSGCGNERPHLAADLRNPGRLERLRCRISRSAI